MKIMQMSSVFLVDYCWAWNILKLRMIYEKRKANKTETKRN